MASILDFFYVLLKGSKLFVINLSPKFIIGILIYQSYTTIWEFKTIGFGKVKALLKIVH